MWGFLESSTNEYIPEEKDLPLLLKLYPDWHILEDKPWVDEVTQALQLAADVTEPANYTAGTFQDILEADEIHRRPLDNSKLPESLDNLTISIQEKCDRLKESLSDRDLETLCRGTLYDLVRETFVADYVSLQIFQLYLDVLPSDFENFLFGLFMRSYGTDRCNENLQEVLDSFAADPYTYVTCETFMKEIKHLPTLIDILETNLSISTYFSSTRLAPEIEHHNICMPKLHIRQWRNLSGQIYFDLNLGAFYGAWQLIWMNIIPDRRNFDAAMDINLFNHSNDDSFTYQVWSDFTSYYSDSRYPKINEHIYDFANGLNYEYYFKCKLEVRSTIEEEVWKKILCNPRSPTAMMNYEMSTLQRRRAKTTVTKLMNMNRSSITCSVIYLKHMNATLNDRPLEASSRSIDFLQAAILMSEANYPESIEMIQIAEEGILKFGDREDIDYVSDIIDEIMGSMKQLYYLKNDKMCGESRLHYTYQDIDLPSLYKLKRADYYISAQDVSSNATILRPINVSIDEVSLFPIEHDSFEWCSHHFQGNPYLTDLKQLYYRLIPDKDSFTIADDNLILQNFTWKQWRGFLSEKDSSLSMRDEVYDDCKNLVKSFESFIGNLKRDLKVKRIYDPSSLYIGIFGAILSLTGLFSMVISIIQVLQAANIIKQISN